MQLSWLIKRSLYLVLFIDIGFVFVLFENGKNLSHRKFIGINI